MQEATAIVDPKNWVQLLDTDEVAKKRLAAIYRAPTPEMMCYLDFSVSTTGMLAGVKVRHYTVMHEEKDVRLCWSVLVWVGGGGGGLSLWCNTANVLLSLTGVSILIFEVIL